MKVLITGATGFIGSKLTEVLVRGGHEVVVISRDELKARRELIMPIEIVQGDLSKSVIQNPALRNIEAVINLAGENVGEGSWSEEEKEKIKSSRVKLSENLEKSLDSEKLKVWLQASAIGYYRDSSGDDWLDEGSASGESFLADVSRAWERTARSLANKKENKPRVVIARIGVVLGHDGGLIGKLLPIFRFGVAGPLGSGDQWMSWIHAEDVVRFFSEALDDENFSGVYNLTAPEPVTNEKFTKTFARLVQRPAALRAPSFIIKKFMGEKSYLALSSQRIKSKLIFSDFVFSYPTIVSALEECCGFTAIEPHNDQRFHYKLRLAYYINQPKEKVFEFFRDPENLEKVAPKKAGITFVEKSENLLKEGVRFKFKIKKGRASAAIDSKVFHFSAGETFTDSQVKGPFKCWHHTHQVYALGKGSIAVDDLIYAFPGGLLGDAAASVKANREIRKTFKQRALSIKKHLEDRK